MIQANAFDEVHDCQDVFRQLLQAISNPGAIVSIAASAAKLDDEGGAMLALALTLLDRETVFSVVDDALLAQSFAQLTYAGNRDVQAGFIFITKPCEAENIGKVLERATPGTLTEPHTGSTLFVSVPEFPGAASARLSGPGIKGARSVGLSDYAKAWLAARDRIEYEYPMGIDLIFVTPGGDVMAIPRKITMEG
jgi:alpha-D-ribose 1-methylphosphonate 5-triphosphate synthase subunit PhnH